MRAALIHKREKHFWNILGSLKRIQAPQAQAPLLPAKPLLQSLTVPADDVTGDIYRLLQEQSYCDVIFVVSGVCVQAHRAVLVTAHDVFQSLLLGELSALDDVSSEAERGVRAAWRLRPAAVAAALGATSALLDDESVSSSVSSLSAESCLSAAATEGATVLRRTPLNHAAFTGLEVLQRHDASGGGGGGGGGGTQTVISVSSDVSPAVLQQVLTYAYTDELPREARWAELASAARLMGLHELALMCSNELSGEAFMNATLVERGRRRRAQRVRRLLLEQGCATGPCSFARYNYLLFTRLCYLLYCSLSKRAVLSVDLLFSLNGRAVLGLDVLFLVKACFSLARYAILSVQTCCSLCRRAVLCADVLFSVQTCCSLSRRAVCSG